MTLGEIRCKGREECLRATGGRTTAVCFGASHSESSAKSRVVQLYASAFVRDRADRKDVNLSMCRIHICSDPYVTRVDTAEHFRVTDFPNPAVPIRRERLAFAPNLARRLVGFLELLRASES